MDVIRVRLFCNRAVQRTACFKDCVRKQDEKEETLLVRINMAAIGITGGAMPSNNE